MPDFCDQSPADTSIRERFRIATVDNGFSGKQRSEAFSKNLLEYVFELKTVPKTGDTKEMKALTEPPPPAAPRPIDSSSFCGNAKTLEAISMWV